MMKWLCFADMGTPEQMSAFAKFMLFVDLFYFCLTISLILGVIALGYGFYCWEKFRKYNEEHPDHPAVQKNARKENTALLLLIVLGFVFSIAFIGFIFSLIAIIRGRSLAKNAEREGVLPEYETLTKAYRRMVEEEAERKNRHAYYDPDLDPDAPEDAKRQ